MHSKLIRTMAAVVVAGAFLPALPPRADAAEPMQQALCAVLKQLNPQVKGFKPEGARAQLVMAIAEKYETDAKQLRQVRTQIDSLTKSGCPKDREAMLGATRTNSLAEALN